MDIEKHLEHLELVYLETRATRKAELQKLRKMEAQYAPFFDIEEQKRITDEAASRVAYADEAIAKFKKKHDITN
jgi:hypothetical protein